MGSNVSIRALAFRLFKNSSHYGVGVFLVRAGSLFLLPLYWRKLDPADFGVIGIVNGILVFLTPVLGFGLADAVQRFYLAWPESKRKSNLGILWLFATVSSAVICLLLECFHGQIFPALFTNVPYEPHLRTGVWSGFALSLSTFPLALWRIREQLRVYVGLTVTSFFMQSGLILFNLFYLNLGLQGYLSAILISNSLSGVVYVGYMFKEVRWEADFKALKETLIYSIPMVPANVGEGVFGVLDRYFLDKFVGLREMGIYSVAGQFGTAFNLFNQILKLSWVPFLFRLTSEREDAPKVLGRLSTVYLAVLALPAICLTAVAREILLLVGNSKFFPSAPLISFFVLAYFISGAATALGRGVELSSRTYFSPLITVVGLTTCVCSLWALVPRYGIWGAVHAFVLTMSARALVQIFIAVKLYPRPVYWSQILVIFIGSMGACILAFQIETGFLYLNIVAKLAICVLVWVFLAIHSIGGSGNASWLMNSALLKMKKVAPTE
ncbi:MAG: oligosaccharide flippase family protein [Bdellovibrionales bacterium]|nr:oligosaccharide flippase family protein [Bdellovibrionales bacterium]